jgi:hypothetical protein
MSSSNIADNMKGDSRKRRALSAERANSMMVMMRLNFTKSKYELSL